MTLVAGGPFEAFEPAGDLLAEFHHDAEAREFYLKAVHATPWNASARVKLADRAGLSKVVADTTAPYAARAEAAKKIAPASVTVTGELALLASGDHSPAAARKPFFAESRFVAAANASDPSVKLSLLREALAIAPDDQSIREASIFAAIGAHNDHLALALYQVLAVPANNYYGPYEIPRPFIPNDQTLLTALGKAAERIGDLAAALRFLPDSGTIKAELNRRSENAKRQPIISGKFEQPQIVRPRLLP